MFLTMYLTRQQKQAVKRINQLDFIANWYYSKWAIILIIYTSNLEDENHIMLSISKKELRVEREFPGISPKSKEAMLLMDSFKPAMEIVYELFPSAQKSKYRSAS